MIKTIKSVNTLIAEVELKDIYQDTRTLRVYFQHKGKTLSEKEVETIRKEIIKEVNQKHKAEIKTLL